MIGPSSAVSGRCEARVGPTEPPWKADRTNGLPAFRMRMPRLRLASAEEASRSPYEGLTLARGPRGSREPFGSLRRVADRKTTLLEIGESPDEGV